MNLSAIFSKTGKGVQEASGKTSHLSRADRSVLSAIDGKTALSEVQKKFEKLAVPKFEALIQQLDKEGFIREVSSGAPQPAAPASRTAASPRGAPPPKAPAADSGEDSGLDFTQLIKAPAATAPKAPPVDLAAASRAESERKAKEQEAFDYKARAEAEARARAEAEAKAKAAAAAARARAEAEAKARAEAEAKARADAEAKARAEADAKVKAAREAAIRLATEAKAKGDAAEERARKEAEDKARLESELNAKLAEERKAREDAERRARDAAETARKELEEKARRDAEELRERLEAEMRAKLEEERKAREAEDRKRREEEDRKRREEDERRRKEDEERRAKEEAERKAREEEDRKRREEDDRRRKADEERRAKEEAERRARKEEEERRAKEEAERRAKEEAERKAKEEAERRAREEQESKRRKEEEERRAKEDADRRKREEDDRRKREEDDRRKRDEAERRAKEEAEAKARAAQSASFPAIEPASMPPPAAPAPAAPAPAAAGAGDFGDSLLADLDSFGKREEEEAKAKEEAERKAKEEAARRAKEEAERKAKEEAEKKRREEEDRRRKEEEERRAQEDAERQAQEEEERAKQEEEDRKRKAKEALAAKKAEERAARAATAKGAARGDDDIGVTDDDLDMDDVKRDHRALAKGTRKAVHEAEHPTLPPVAARRPRKWGKPAAIALFVLLVGGVGLLNVMPVSTAEYETAASEAMGVPVKVASARLSVITGVEMKFEGVSIGDGVKIRLARGYPEVGSLFGGKKAFSRIELEGASISQAQLADAVLGKVSGENFRVGRIVIKQAKFDGPLALPALDVEATVAGDGSLQSVTARGGDKLSVQLTPKGGDIGFEISAGSLALPFVPALTLSDFGMKGTANRGGVVTSEFDGRVFDGVINGTAKIRWGASWTVDGELRARALKVAVFAPALVSEGKVEGRAAYSMSGSVPASLFESAKLQGDFKIEKGVLGSFNLTRALQTGGAQSSGRTEFSELTGQAVYDKGAVQVRNVSITAGAMSAGATLDIDAIGGLSGRVVADVKTPNQTLRATLNVSGKVTDPVVRK